MADLQLQYVINATMGKLDGLTSLMTQLQELKRLSAEGADFNVRVDPVALQGISRAVGRAVAAGVWDGAKPGGTASGGGAGGASTGNGDLGAVVIELRKVTEALKGLTGEGGTGPVRRRAASPAVAEAAPLERAVASAEAAAGNHTGKLRELITKINNLTSDIVMERGKAGEYYTEIERRLADAQKVSGKGYGRRVNSQVARLRGTMTTAPSGSEEEYQAIVQLTELWHQERSKLLDKQVRLSQRLQNEVRHARVQRDNQEWRGEAAAHANASPSGRSTGGGLAFNQAAIDAAFTHAADVFGQRLLAYLPDVGGRGSMPRGADAHVDYRNRVAAGNGYAPPMSGGGFRNSTVANYGSGQRHVCPRCNGTGRYPSSMNNGLCFKCGGTGDDTHPDPAHVGSFGGAAAPAGSSAARANNNPFGTGELQYSEVLGDLVVPHSKGRRQEIVQRLNLMQNQISNRRYNPSTKRHEFLPPDQIEAIQERMAPFIDEFNVGGLPLSAVKGHQQVVNGIFGTAAEAAQYKTNPMMTPVRASTGGLVWDGNNPIRAMSGHVNDLTESFKHLQGVDFSAMEKTFAVLGGSLGRLAEDMKAVKVASTGMVGKDLELHYTKLLNAEKERHATVTKDATVNERNLRNAKAVMDQADRLRAADALSQRGREPLSVSPFDADRAPKRLTSSLRRLGRMDERLDDLRTASAVSGGAGGYDTQRLRVGAERAALRSGVLRQALAMASADPSSMPVSPSTLSLHLQREDEYAQAASALTRYRRYSTAARVFGRVKKADGTYSSEYVDAVQGRDTAYGELQRYGIASGNGTKTKYSTMLEGLATKRADMEGNAQGLLKQVVAQHEVRLAADKASGGFNILGKKLQDLAAYLIAGGILYGAINTFKRSLMETMKFESDMADVQGIFVAKTKAQRDDVKAGVMSAATEFGANRSQVAAVAKMFAQTGANPTKTMDLTRSALLAQKGAGLNIDQASEMLIAVDNITKGAVKPTDIIDRISRVEARHAVTAQDLSSIIQKAAPMAAMMQPKMLGNVDELDTLMGMGTTLIEKTRMSGSAAGTTLKFLMARLSAPQVQRKLQDQFGINLGGENPDDMRAMSDIFGDIATKYKHYQGSGQSGKAAALLTTFAGARQANAAASIFDDWKGTMDVARESSLAFGDAQRRLAIQMDTLQTKTGQLGAAFDNFSTNFFEKTGLLSALKVGAGAGTSVLNVAANHPDLALLGAGGALMTIGRLVSAGAKSGALSKFGMLGAAAPTLAGLATGGGIAAAGFGAFAATRKFLMQDEWDRMEEQDRYGPSTFKRSTYVNSEQGKDFAQIAGGYGLSSEGLYTTMAAATKYAEDATKQKFGEGYFGENAKTDPKLGKYLEEKLVERLKETLPGFKDIKDQSEATATALETLRKSAQYGGVSYFAEQGKFQEDATGLGQDFSQNMAGDPSAATRQMLARAQQWHYEMALGDTTAYGVGKKTNLATFAPRDLGMLYNADIANQMGHTTASARGEDIRKILNSEQKRLSIGDVVNRLRLTNGETFLSKVNEYLKVANSLGLALDKAADSVERLSKADYDHLTTLKEQGKITKEQLAQLDRGSNYKALVTEMKAQLGISLEKQDRTANAAAQGVGTDGREGEVAGGKFVEKIVQAMEDASREQLKGMDNQSPEYKQLKAYIDAHFTAENRPQTRLNVMSALSGGNIKAYLRDRVFDEMLKYGERNTEIGLSSKYLNGTGVAFNSAQERAANSQSFLQGLIKVSAQLPTDELRAVHRLSMASVERSGFETAGYDDPGDLPEAQRSVFTTSFLKSLEKVKAKGQINDSQITTLGIALQSIRAAAKEWATGKPNELFDSLGPKAQAKMKGLIGLSDKELLATGLSQSEFYLDFAKKHTTQDIATATGQSIDLANRQAGGTRGLARQQAGYDLDTARLQNRLALAGLSGDVFGANLLDRGGVAQARAHTIALAQGAHDVTMDSLYAQARQTGQLDQHGYLQGDLLKQANDAANTLKAAVEEANLAAVRGMLDLVNQAHLDLLQRQKEHLTDLSKIVSDPITQLLGNPKQLLGSGKFGALAESIGSGISQRQASTFMNNLVGEGGLFEGKFKKLFDQPMFAEADLIKRAHIDGIMQGFAAAGYHPGVSMADGTASTPVTLGGAASGAGAATGVILGGAAALSPLLSKSAAYTGGSHLTQSTIYGDVKDPEWWERLKSYSMLKTYTKDTTEHGDPTSVEEARAQLAKYGTTLTQRSAYTKNFSEILYNNISPDGYTIEGQKDQVLRALKQVTTEPLTYHPAKVLPHRLKYADGSWQGPVDVPSEDAWRLYLGLPQASNSFGISDYMPNNAKVKKPYFRLNKFPFLTDPAGRDGPYAPSYAKQIEGIAKSLEKQKADGYGSSTSSNTWVLGDYKISAGKDKKGSYLSYYDLWDLNIPGSAVVGKPFEVYDRVYYDPKTYEPLTPVDHRSAGGNNSGLPRSPFTDKRAAFNGGAHLAGGMGIFPALNYVKRAFNPLTNPGAALPGYSLTPNTTTAKVGQFTFMQPGDPGVAQMHAQIAQQEAARLKALKETRQAALKQAALMATQFASTEIFGSNGIKNRDGQPNNYASEGSSMGAMIGSMIPIPGGTFIGAALGGLVGSRFGKNEPPLPPAQFEALGRIERNTRETVDSITNQTRSLLSPENRLLYAPSTFQMPGYRPFDAGSSKSVAGGGGDMPSIVIHVNGADNPQLVAETVAAHLKEQLSGYGSYTDPRF